MCCPLDMALVLDLKPLLNKSWCLEILPILWIYLTGHFRQYVVHSMPIIHSMLLVNYRPVIGRKLTEAFISTLDLTHYCPHRNPLTHVQECLTWGWLIPNLLSWMGDAFSGRWGQQLTHPCCLSFNTLQRPVKSSKLSDREKHLSVPLQRRTSPDHTWPPDMVQKEWGHDKR